ncbi:MAG: hypothetical protein ABUL72_02125, partial [Armatimonadota bacterium]
MHHGEGSGLIEGELTSQELRILLTYLTVREMGGSGAPDLKCVAELTGHNEEDLAQLLASIRTFKRDNEFDQR